MIFEKKNVLLLVPTFADEGGTQKMVYELGRILAEKYNVFECSFNAFGEPHVFKNDSNVILSLNSPNERSLLSKLKGYPQKIARLKELKKKHKIDVTISNLWGADLVNALSKGKDKIISIGHSSIVGNPQSRLLLKLRRLGEWVYSRFDKIIAVNSSLEKELTDLFNLPRIKVKYINNFIAFPPSGNKDNRTAKELRRLVNVGRLHEGKNLEPLLIILKKLKKEFVKLQLVLIGNGPMKESLIKKAGELDLIVSDVLDERNADLIFTGFVNPFPVLESSDVFVFPSKTEGLPLVLVEAMHTGLPIISSDCPTGGPHVILEAYTPHDPKRVNAEETKYGYLMPIPESNDLSALQVWQETISLLLKNEEKRVKLGHNAKERSLDFSVDKIKHLWFQTIDSLFESNR
ncbi:glycosyltransferase [Rufibacter hautae]|uniref:Glycosyltransferase family 4 protein n=1 Tax=Rufibacter hautae TaxID=2595005 RepID=A0A5B6T8S5_9BACT|nr:glycosyltransferase [Rufibacter hautae]KAA3436586.1 glycosyltransferase family 4 protein [Rufibacter hautae]